jgi:hypothetical protein
MGELYGEVTGKNQNFSDPGTAYDMQGKDCGSQLFRSGLSRFEISTDLESNM